MVCGMYGRSIRTGQFGKDKNPGSIDTQQSIYLAICDVFVTADRLQRRMLRLLACFGHRKKASIGNIQDLLYGFWINIDRSNRRSA